MDDAIKDSSIHTQQHGFHTNRNTDTAISTVTDYIEKHIYNQKHVIGFSLDIQAALDSIKPSKWRQPTYGRLVLQVYNPSQYVH